MPRSTGSIPATHRHQTAAVGDRGSRPAVEQRAVEEAGHAVGLQLAHPLGEARTARHEDICAELREQRPIRGRLRDIGQHAQAIGLGELDGVAADRACRARDRQGLTGFQPERVEPEAHGERVHEQRRRRGELHTLRRAHRGRSGHHDLLRVAALVRRGGRSHGDHPLAEREPAIGPGSERVDHAGGVHAGDVRRLLAVEALARAAAARHEIGGVHRDSVHANSDFTGPRLRLGQLDHLQHLGTAETIHADGFHGRDVAPGGERDSEIATRVKGDGTRVRGYWHLGALGRMTSFDTSH